MSIYGPCSKTSRPSGEESKKYIDARVVQLRTNLLPKTGGTIAGSLAINSGNLSINTTGGGPEIDIRQRSTNSKSALPGGVRIRNPSDNAHFQLGWSADGELAVYYSSRENPTSQVVCTFSPTNLTSLSPPVNPLDVATKQYVDESCQSLITIWAEEKGSLTSGHYEWSFGGGAEGRSHSKCGYPLPTAGHIVKLALASTTSSGSPSGELTVFVVLNGATTGGSITKPSGERSSAVRVHPPIKVPQGATINFVTDTTRVEARSSIVSALIAIH
jgi:hypothetical protein